MRLHWRGWFAALLVGSMLAGCAQRTTGQAGTPDVPYPHQHNGTGPEHGGGDGGGGGGGM